MFVIVFCFSLKERQCTGQHSYRTVTEHTKLITHLRIRMIVRVYKCRSIEQLNSVIRWHQICKNVFHIGSVRCLPRLVCIALRTFHSELQYIFKRFFFRFSLSHFMCICSDVDHPLLHSTSIHIQLFIRCIIQFFIRCIIQFFVEIE